MSKMCSEETRRQCKLYLSIEHRLSEYFGLSKEPSKIYKEEEEEDEEAVEGQYYIQIYLLRPSLAIVSAKSVSAVACGT